MTPDDDQKKRPPRSVPPELPMYLIVIALVAAFALSPPKGPAAPDPAAAPNSPALSAPISAEPSPSDLAPSDPRVTVTILQEEGSSALRPERGSLPRERPLLREEASGSYSYAPALSPSRRNPK